MSIMSINDDIASTGLFLCLASKTPTTIPKGIIKSKAQKFTSNVGGRESKNSSVEEVRQEILKEVPKSHLVKIFLQKINSCSKMGL